MITFLLLTVTFSHAEEKVGYSFNQEVHSGWQKYNGVQCFANDVKNDKTRCDAAAECEWSQKCDEACGFKELSKDCTDVSIPHCVFLGYSESECFSWGCGCEWSLEECKKKGYHEDDCRNNGCGDPSQTCTCDSRGRHHNSKGDWCYLKSTPCTFLSGTQAKADWTWSNCEYEGKTQVDCPDAEVALADAFPDVPKPEEKVGYSFNQEHHNGKKVFNGAVCWGKGWSSCQNAPECDWFKSDCEWSCGYKNLRNGCGDITISRCKEMGYEEDSCFAYKCVCDMSLEECTNKGNSKAYCEKAGCGDASKTCTCDSRGVQTDKKGVQWCYLNATPCTFLDGSKAEADWTWADCEYKGKKQVECKAAVPEDPNACKCDSRGRLHHSEGDWCYLESTPCNLLSGGEAKASWSWASCEWEGKTQLDCPVICGGHQADDCAGCPQGHGAAWCNGMCAWQNNQCVLKSEEAVASPVEARGGSGNPSVAVKTSDNEPSFAVRAFAVLGFGAIVYGAGRYYLSK